MQNIQRLAMIFAVVVIILGPATVMLAQEADASEGEMAEQITLTGQLSETDTGSYVLVERESGEEISVQGPEELADHVGHSVHVTGEWAENEEGNAYFAVSSIEPATDE